MNPVPLFLIIVTLPLLLGGCGEKRVAEVKPESDSVNAEELEERKGITYLKKSNTPFTGKCLDFWSNGKKATEVNYKDGKKDGQTLFWHNNGQKKKESNYKDGKSIGRAKYWNRKGEPVDFLTEL